MYIYSVYSIYNYIYISLHWLDIIGLLQIAKLVAAQYTSLMGIMGTMA